MMDRNKVLQEYWDKNIGKYSGFYDVTSEESLIGFQPLLALYRKFIFPIEKKVTRDRYEYVKNVIEKHVHAGTKVADVGCGGGVFTKLAVEVGADVFALDFAPSALELTKSKLSEEQRAKVVFEQYDVTSQMLPVVDVCLIVGVMPYIADLTPFFDHVLPSTQLAVFNYLEKNNPFNLVRRIFPFLNVRNYSYHSTNRILEQLSQRGFTATKISKLSTGFIITAEKKTKNISELKK